MTFRDLSALCVTCCCYLLALYFTCCCYLPALALFHLAVIYLLPLGVSAKMKELVSHFISLHARAHTLELDAHTALAETEYMGDYFTEIIQLVYNEYANSPKQLAGLADVAALIGGDLRKFAGLHGIRWRDSCRRALATIEHNLIQTCVDLQAKAATSIGSNLTLLSAASCFIGIKYKHQMEGARNKLSAKICDACIDAATNTAVLRVRAGTGKGRVELHLSIGEVLAQLADAAHGDLAENKHYKLYCHLTSMWFLSTLYFMLDVHDVLAVLSKQLQAGKLTIVDYLHHTTQACEKLRAMDGNDRRHTSKFENALDRDAQLYHGMPVGGMEEELYFAADKLTALDAFPRLLEERAQLKDPVLSALLVFDKSRWPPVHCEGSALHGVGDLQLLFQHYHKLMPSGCELIDVCTSFHTLRKFVQEAPSLNNLSHYDMWMHLLSNKHRDKFDVALLTLAEISFVVPVDTSFLERAFALMNRLNSKSRNRLLPEMVNHLMIICLLGPQELGAFQELVPAIIKRWRANKKNGRHISKMFKGQEAHHPVETGRTDGRGYDDIFDDVNDGNDRSIAQAILQHLEQHKK